MTKDTGYTVIPQEYSARILSSVPAAGHLFYTGVTSSEIPLGTVYSIACTGGTKVAMLRQGYSDLCLGTISNFDSPIDIGRCFASNDSRFLNPDAGTHYFTKNNLQLNASASKCIKEYFGECQFSGTLYNFKETGSTYLFKDYALPNSRILNSSIIELTGDSYAIDYNGVYEGTSPSGSLVLSFDGAISVIGILVTGQGGGGGGGSGKNYNGGGGGGGAGVGIALLDLSMTGNGDAYYYITLGHSAGAGGSGGTGTNPTAGGTGEQSAVRAIQPGSGGSWLVTAYGGGGGRPGGDASSGTSIAGGGGGTVNLSSQTGYHFPVASSKGGAGGTGNHLGSATMGQSCTISGDLGRGETSCSYTHTGVGKDSTSTKKSGGGSGASYGNGRSPVDNGSAGNDGQPGGGGGGGGGKNNGIGGGYKGGTGGHGMLVIFIPDI